MTTFQITGIRIGSDQQEEEENDDEFPQAPTRSYLKLTNVVDEAVNETTTTVPTPPPPPPPPFLPPPPPPLFPTVKDSHLNAPTMALNTETLMMAKQKLKLTTALSESDAKISTQTTQPHISNNTHSKVESKTRKNEFLLQEIQNHRLYNTKKDYVLDFLDRNKVTTSANTSTTTVTPVDMKFARSLSSSNMAPLKTTPDRTGVDKVEAPPPAPAPIYNYERFPHARSRKITHSSNITTATLCSNHRAQSSSGQTNNRLSGPSLGPAAVSVENLNKKCIVIIRNRDETERLKSVANNNSIPKYVAVQRSSSTAPTPPLPTNPYVNKVRVHVVNDNSNVATINVGVGQSVVSNRKKSFENAVESSSSNINYNSGTQYQDAINQSLAQKKFKQFQPPEKFESELDRVFKVFIFKMDLFL